MTAERRTIHCAERQADVLTLDTEQPVCHVASSLGSLPGLVADFVFDFLPFESLLAIPILSPAWRSAVRESSAHPESLRKRVLEGLGQASSLPSSNLWSMKAALYCVKAVLKARSLQIPLDGDGEVILGYVKARLSTHTDNSGLTALSIASYEGRTEVVKLLLDGGADPNVRVVVRFALPLPDPDRKVLTAHVLFWQDGRSALIFSAQYGNAEIVELLIEAKADLTAQTNDQGWNALMIASAYGREEVVRQLIHAGADVNARDSFGQTALTNAAAKGHRKICALLAGAGRAHRNSRRFRRRSKVRHFHAYQKVSPLWLFISTSH